MGLRNLTRIAVALVASLAMPALASPGRVIEMSTPGGTRTVTIGRELGRGAFGRVHEAAVEGGSKVVLKIMKAGGASERESAVLRATMGRPRLLQVLGEGTIDHDTVLMLPFVAGVPLGKSQHIAKREVGKAVRIAMNVLRDLRELHASGYLHADVAPQNVLIDGERSASARLIDYGNAVKPGENVSSTWEYMPPEQFREDGSMGPNADTYATAGVLVAMLTGRPPRRTSNADQRRGLQQEHEAGRIDFRDAEIPNARLRVVLRKALDPDPAQRYESAQALIDALREFSLL